MRCQRFSPNANERTGGSPAKSPESFSQWLNQRSSNRSVSKIASGPWSTSPQYRLQGMWLQGPATKYCGAFDSARRRW